MTTQALATKINTFDYYYEMSDSQRTYINGRSSEKEIKNIVSTMNENELMEARKLITVSADLLNRYFAGLFPEPKPEPIESANSILFKTAWTILKSGYAPTFSIALKKAWVIMRINLKGNLTISYAKETGELREANVIGCGTLETISKGFIRYRENIEGKEQWRSFRIERLATA